jgi:hypothetical protein
MIEQRASTPEEWPVRRVEVDGFWIDEHPVTDNLELEDAPPGHNVSAPGRGEEPEEATFHAGRMRLPEAAARALVSLTIHPQRMMLRERPIARLGPMSTSTPDVNR